MIIADCMTAMIFVVMRNHCLSQNHLITVEKKGLSRLALLCQKSRTKTARGVDIRPRRGRTSNPGWVL